MSDFSGHCCSVNGWLVVFWFAVHDNKIFYDVKCVSTNSERGLLVRRIVKSYSERLQSEHTVILGAPEVSHHCWHMPHNKDLIVISELKTHISPRTQRYLVKLWAFSVYRASPKWMAKVNKRLVTKTGLYVYIWGHTVISVLCDAIIKKDVINKPRVLLATSINK